MNVFISWSGTLSGQLAETLRRWLPAVLQVVKPYFTPSDIDKGSRWSKEIATELEKSQFGIVCLTFDNLQKPWVMFEAGALSKHLDSSHVCPILFDVENTDLAGPLVQFQTTLFSKKEIRKLIQTINELCGENKLTDTVLDKVFEMWWPKLEEEIQIILTSHAENSARVEIRKDRDLLEEILTLSRSVASNSTIYHNAVDQRTVKTILEAFVKLHNKISVKSEHDITMGILRDMGEPLENIISLSSFSEPIRNEMIETISRLDFEIRGSNNWLDPSSEDENPF